MGTSEADHVEVSGGPALQAEVCGLLDHPDGEHQVEHWAERGGMTVALETHAGLRLAVWTNHDEPGHWHAVVFSPDDNETLGMTCAQRSRLEAECRGFIRHLLERRIEKAQAAMVSLPKWEGLSETPGT